MKCVTLFQKDAFHMGYKARRRAKPLWLQDDLFSSKWDQMNYERGWHFAAWLIGSGKGNLKITMNKRPDAQTRSLFQTAVNQGAVL